MKNVLKFLFFVLVNFIVFSCKDSITPYDDSELRKKISELEDKQKELESENETQTEQIKALEERIKALEELSTNFSSLRTDLDNLSVKVEQLDFTYDDTELKNSITTFKESLTTDYTNFQTNLLKAFENNEQILNKSVEELSSDLTTLNSIVAEKQDVEELKQEIDKITTKLDSMKQVDLIEVYKQTILYFNTEKKLIYAESMNCNYSAKFMLDAELQKNKSTNKYETSIVQTYGLYSGTLRVLFSPQICYSYAKESYKSATATKADTNIYYCFNHDELYSGTSDLVHNNSYQSGHQIQNSGTFEGSPSRYVHSYKFENDIIDQENMSKCSLYGFSAWLDNYDYATVILFGQILTPKLEELYNSYMTISQTE